MALMSRVRHDSQPRPVLQMSPPSNTFDSSVLTMQDAMGLVNNVTNNLTNGTYGTPLIMELMTLTNCLPYWGQHLEVYYNDQLNRVFVEFRRSASDDRVDMVSRKLLLFLIEMRSGNWQVNEPMSRYFKTDEYMAMCNSESPSASLPSPTLPVALLLAPGETIKTSGKFPKPTKIPGKNYYKDEVVIRNSDSGKVMGIKGRRVHMIEELSETVISFQRVNPGAKERLVQVTGADEAHINYAKQLMGDTIRRNASPVPCRSDQLADLERPVGGSSSSVNSSTSDESAPQGYPRSRLHHSLSTNDASIGDYKYTVMVGNNAVKITGADYTLVMKSKLALDKFFESEPQQQVDCGEFFTSYDESDYLPAVELVELVSKPEPSPVQPSSVDVPPETICQTTIQSSSMNHGSEPKLCYSWSMLCKLSQSQLCQEAPNDWDLLCPTVLRKVSVKPPESVVPHATNLLRMTSLPAGIGQTKTEHHVVRRASQPLYTVNQSEGVRRSKPLFADVETEKNKRLAFDTETEGAVCLSRTKPLFGDIETEIKRRISSTSLVNDVQVEPDVLKLRALSLDTKGKLTHRAACLQITAAMEMAEITGVISPILKNLPLHFQTPENMALYNVKKHRGSFSPSFDYMAAHTALSGSALPAANFVPPRVSFTHRPEPSLDYMAAHAVLSGSALPAPNFNPPQGAVTNQVQPCVDFMAAHLALTKQEKSGLDFMAAHAALTNQVQPRVDFVAANATKQEQSDLDFIAAHAASKQCEQVKPALGQSRSFPNPGMALRTLGYHANVDETSSYKTTIPFRPALTNSNIRAQNSGPNPIIKPTGAYQTWVQNQKALTSQQLPLTPSHSPVDEFYQDTGTPYKAWLQLHGNPGYNPASLTPSPETIEELLQDPIVSGFNPLTPSPEASEPNIGTTSISFRPKFAYSRGVALPELDFSEQEHRVADQLPLAYNKPVETPLKSFRPTITNPKLAFFNDTQRQ